MQLETAFGLGSTAINPRVGANLLLTTIGLKMSDSTDQSIVNGLLAVYEQQIAVKADLVQFIAELPDSVLQARDLAKLVHLMSDLDKALPRDPFKVTISVVGSFRGGKSTLINALIGAELLPATTSPTTATITSIKYQSKLRYVATIQFKEQNLFSAGEQTLAQLLDSNTPASQIFKKSSMKEAGEIDSDLQIVLGAFGVLKASGIVIDERRYTETIVRHWREKKCLPPYPLQHECAFGTKIRIELRFVSALVKK